MLYEYRRFVWVYVFGYVNTSSTDGSLTAVNGEFARLAMRERLQATAARSVYQLCAVCINMYLRFTDNRLFT